MAIAVIQTFEATREEYDAVQEKLDPEANPPEGGIVHTAGTLSNGRMRVIDIWESEADFQRFREERLAPAIAEVAGETPVPEIEIYELFDLQVNG
jgi:hypothetical protein